MKSLLVFVSLSLVIGAAGRPAAAATSILTVPSSASIHGNAGAFFHSDLWVMNRSASSSIPVTATYRCFAGPCPASAQAQFTLAARESRVFSDVDVSLFSAPETAGAIELSWDDGLGKIAATSRVYTPQLPAPTFGTGIPGLASTAAFSGAVFLGLGNNGGDLSSGFRSNAGAYNPNDVPVTVTYQLIDTHNAAVGSPVVRSIPAKGAVQVNDVFANAGAGSTVSTNVMMHATTSPSAPLFFNVTVIDNQSGDSIWVAPATDEEDTASFPDIQVIPASASIHGNAGTFFHTDVWLRNGSSSSPLGVAASYHCITGCDTATKGFILSPGETREFSDVDGTLFDKPESAGAITFMPTAGSGKLVVTSRTYTPSLPAPTNGTGIRGVSVAEVRTDALFLGLGSNGGDLSSGFRTNAGVYNPLPFDATVTFTLYSASGAKLGSVSKDVVGLQAVQINDVFGAVGAGSTVTTNAYLVVEATLPMVPYVTVIDNRSGDSSSLEANDGP